MYSKLYVIKLIFFFLCTSDDFFNCLCQLNEVVFYTS